MKRNAGLTLRWIRRWALTGMLAWVRARRRYRLLDHAARAATRYREAGGRRLAAAVTYYAFFAVFALALLGFATLGYVLHEPAVEDYLASNLPQLDTGAIRDARGALGAIAFISLPVIGWLWVDALRSSLRAIWRREQYPGPLLRRILVELLVLVGLGVLLGVSLAVALGTTALMDWLVIDLLGADAAPARWLLSGVAFLLGLGINTVLAVAVLTALSRLRVRPRWVLGPALLVAVGLEVLKTAGRVFVEHTDANPAFQLAAGTAGLLVFLFLFNQLMLFAAALAATAGPSSAPGTVPRQRRARRSAVVDCPGQIS